MGASARPTTGHGQQPLKITMVPVCVSQPRLLRRLTQPARHSARPRHLAPDHPLARAGPAPTPKYTRGYGALYLERVLQADEGCDFDFLRGRSDEAEREPLGLLARRLVTVSGDAVDAVAGLGIEEVEPLGIDCDLERLALMGRRAA
jgi:hypothetical protein